MLNQIADNSEIALNSQYIFSLMLFALSTTITPGPNNLMLTASGGNFGYLRTVPHLLGITLGFTVLITAVALGLGAVFTHYPILQWLLKAAGALYLFWLAWKIATAKRSAGVSTGNPLTVLQASLFQWVNPKTWTMALTGISTFALEGDNLAWSMLVVIATFALVSFPCCSLWALFGSRISGHLKSDRALAWFNRTLGGLTALSVVLIIS